MSEVEPFGLPTEAPSLFDGSSLLGHVEEGNGFLNQPLGEVSEYPKECQLGRQLGHGRHGRGGMVRCQVVFLSLGIES